MLSLISNSGSVPAIHSFSSLSFEGLSAWLWTMGGNPRRHEENMQTLHRDAPSETGFEPRTFLLCGDRANPQKRSCPGHNVGDKSKVHEPGELQNITIPQAFIQPALCWSPQICSIVFHREQSIRLFLTFHRLVALDWVSIKTQIWSCHDQLNKLINHLFITRSFPQLCCSLLTVPQLSSLSQWFKPPPFFLWTSVTTVHMAANTSPKKWLCLFQLSANN